MGWPFHIVKLPLTLAKHHHWLSREDNQLLRINKTEAERILREEVDQSIRDPGDPSWVGYVEELSELCKRSNIKTVIAFLGTALLAKCVDARADLKWIKPTHAVDAPFAFSARTLSEQVLVPVAADLGIHIGVTSPQPLNNQPFFRMTYLGDSTPIARAGKPAFDMMLGLVGKLGPMSEAESRKALRAYVSVRRRYQPRYTESSQGINVSPGELKRHIVSFLEAGSEGGKRAQACVAALFDVAFGSENIASGRINDPSRDRPGDVCVLRAGDLVKSIEVKDKPVSFNDVQIFGKKVVDMGGRDAAYVMVGAGQQVLDLQRLSDWADGFGLGLTLFYDWGSLVDAALFWSSLPKRDAANLAAERVHLRLIAVEAEPISVDLWKSLVRGTQPR